MRSDCNTTLFAAVFTVITIIAGSGGPLRIVALIPGAD